MSSSESDVIIEDIGHVGVITLNRPKALNSLDLSMVRKIHPALIRWEKEKSLVIVKAAGDKAFCAGGDVKAVVQSAMKGGDLGFNFFREEYLLNGLIGSYKIPYIALINGICMGGGVGLSVHGKYRVATETTLFAMPETQIGLFPDVGGTYFLPRLGGRLGYYLALTGHRLKGKDVVKAGIATHLINSDEINTVYQELLKCKTDKDIAFVLKKNNVNDNSEFSLAKDMDMINNVFSCSTIEGMFTKLKDFDTCWSIKVLDTLKKMSPTSLKVTLKALDLGKQMSLNDCLQMEFRLAVSSLVGKDFIEGIIIL